jgi:hypothetical protein
MEAKPAELMLLPSPVIHQQPKKLKTTILCTTPGCKMNRDHRPACAASTSSLCTDLLALEPISEQHNPKPPPFISFYLPVMSDHRGMHASVSSGTPFSRTPLTMEDMPSVVATACPPPVR